MLTKDFLFIPRNAVVLVFGGALFLYWNSSVSWDEETTFVSNTVNDSGGALFSGTLAFRGMERRLLSTTRLTIPGKLCSLVVT